MRVFLCGLHSVGRCYRHAWRSLCYSVGHEVLVFNLSAGGDAGALAFYLVENDFADA